MLCFYLALFLLTYIDVVTTNAVWIILPIFLSVIFLVPLLLVQRTMIESITHPDSELIGEVQEFMASTMDLRTQLVDALFPNFNNQLMEQVDWPAILEVFDKFDDDRSFTIEPSEFLAGCRLIGLYYSSYKAKRLLRLLDSDRSGEIDPEEVFELVFQEKIDRVVKKVGIVFDKLGEINPENNEKEIRLENMERVMKMLYGNEVPAGVVESAISHVKEDDDDELFNIGDFSDWVKHQVSSGRNDAEKEMTRVKNMILEKNDKTGEVFKRVLEEALSKKKDSKKVDSSQTDNGEPGKMPHPPHGTEPYEVRKHN